jgi:hypothetical protein
MKTQEKKLQRQELTDCAKEWYWAVYKKRIEHVTVISSLHVLGHLPNLSVCHRFIDNGKPFKMGSGCLLLKGVVQ